jgi:hypothetical protein
VKGVKFMGYRKLKKEEMTVSLEQSIDGDLVVIVGMYEKDNWRQCIPIRLTNFPEACESIEKFNFEIDAKH